MFIKSSTSTRDEINSIIEEIKAIPDIDNKIDRSVLAIREELVSVQAINPFANHNSASRGLMQTGQFAQKAVIINPEPKIIQEGITYQLSSNTWKCIVKHNCVVKSIITSKNNYDIENTETILLVVELPNGDLDVIDIPLYYSISEFGFRYKRNIELLSSLVVGSKLDEGTVLAETPGVVNDTYAFGINADMKLVTDPDVGQDGVKVSQELMEKMAHRIYHKLDASFDNDKILLNVYGDVDNYIALPKVGETISNDGIVFALRQFSPQDVPPNKYNTTIIDPIYDECYYINNSNKVINVAGNSTYNNKVVSVKVYKSPVKKDINLHGKEDVEVHVDDMKQVYRRLIQTYEKLKNNNQITPRMSKLLVEAYAVAGNDGKVELRHRNDTFTTRVEIVVETTVIPGIGSKVSDKIHDCHSIFLITGSPLEFIVTTYK